MGTTNIIILLMGAWLFGRNICVFRFRDKILNKIDAINDAGDWRRAGMLLAEYESVSYYKQWLCVHKPLRLEWWYSEEFCAAIDEADTPPRA